MNAIETAEYSLRDKELRFIGKPDSCVGELHLVNHSNEKLRIKKLPIHGGKAKGPVEIAVDELRIFARLMPRGSAQVSASLELPAQTPPGKYRSEVVIGEERRPVVIDVLESWEIAVAPTEMSLKIRNGESVRRVILLANRGNVPWKTPKAIFVTMQEVDGTHRSLFQALKQSKAGDYEAVLNDFAARLRESEVESAVLKIVSGPAELPAGDAGEFEIEINFQEPLKRHRQYLGKARFEHAELTLDIEAIEPAGGQPKESK